MGSVGFLIKYGGATEPPEDQKKKGPLLLEPVTDARKLSKYNPAHAIRAFDSIIPLAAKTVRDNTRQPPETEVF